MLGVSPDPVKAVAKFDDKYGLGFPLLADEDHSVAAGRIFLFVLASGVAFAIVSALVTWAYLAVAALEIALSRGLREAVGDLDPEKR